jgi:hypothetical protein
LSPRAGKVLRRRLGPWSRGAFLGASLLLGGTNFARAQDTATQLPETRVTAPRPVALEPREEPVPPPPPLPPTNINPLTESGRTLPMTNAIGAPVSVSQGLVTQAQLVNQPIFRTTDFFEQIPGLIFSNETNGIDANTMFLRGFLIDHGTDFAFFVDGMPMNLDSNPHAQGYTDLQFVIPELVRDVEFGKGPYYAKVGNFSAVGYANVQYFDELPYGFAKIEAGRFDWFRVVAADSGCVGPGVLLYGVQFNYFNNAYVTPEHLNKSTLMLRYTIADDSDKLTFSTNIYNGQGTAEPIIPLRVVYSGVDRFANLSPTDFIVADRFTANTQWTHHWANDAVTQGNVYAYRFTLSLTENPSGFTANPDGTFTPNQIDQIDRRWVEGANFSHTWNTKFLGEQVANTLGVNVRHDDVDPAAIYNTVDRIKMSPAAAYNVSTTDVGLYYQNETKWSEKVRSIVGVRGEFYTDSVTNSFVPANSGAKTTEMFLPKGSLVLGPWNLTEFYLNAGYSFHSNNAEGAVASTDANGNPVSPVPLLVQARGAEVGVRTQRIRDLTSTVALWQLHLGSELVFDPVAETTVPLRSSDRYGIEWTNTYQVCDWLTLNADYSWSHGRLIGFDPNVPGQHIPLAPTTVFSAGPSVKLRNGLFANLRYRYWGSRYLIEDGSASSRATNLFELATGYECMRYTINVSFLNLFNSNGHDIDFFNSTFYPNFGDTAPVNDILFKPLQPFAVRASFTLRW